MNAGWPSCTFCSSRVTWLSFATFWRFTSRMTSPGTTPPLAAGLLRSTSLTIAPPALAGSSRRRAISGVIGSSVIPKTGDVRAGSMVLDVFRRDARVCSASRSSSSTVTVSVLRWLLRKTTTGTSVPVVVFRNNQRRSLSVTIDELDLEAEQTRTSRRNTSSTIEPAPTSPVFGMTLAPITPDLARRLELPANAGGAIVSDVDRNSPAANGGVSPGDVILEVNRQKVANESQVTRELQKAQPGQPVFMLVWRDGNNVFVTMTKR